MASTSGFMIGVIGGILDFASATSLLVNPASQASGMGVSSSPNYAWIAGLYILGVVVIATTVFSVTSSGIRFARLLSLLMLAFGVIMIISGWFMTTGNMAAGGYATLYGYGMLLVGALMLVNGALMMRSPMMA